MQVVEIQAPGLVSVRSGGHYAAAGKAISQHVREQERREMVQCEGLLEALRGLPARGEQCTSIVGKDGDVFVALADLVGQHPNVGHQRQVGHVPADPAAATGRRGFLSDRLDALGIASHDGDVGSSPGEFDRSGSPDAASRPGEHDDGHTADLTLQPDAGKLAKRLLVHMRTGKRTRWRSSATPR